MDTDKDMNEKSTKHKKKKMFTAVGFEPLWQHSVASSSEKDNVETTMPSSLDI